MKFNLLFLSLLLLSSPLSAEEATRETKGGKALTQITIAEYGEFLLYSSLYVAQAKGFFQQEGLEVKIVPAGGDEKVFAALLSGNAEFGVSDPTFTAIAGQRGQAGRVVASILQNVPAWGITKDESIQKIKTPEELSQYTVATYPAPSTSYTLQKIMFESAGLKTNIRQISYGGLLAALDTGVIDIVLENEPNVSLAIQKGAHRVYSLNEYYPEFAFTGLTALPGYIEENPKIVQKVVNAFQRASNYIFEDREGTIAVLAKRFPELTNSVIASSIENTIKANTFPKDGVMKKNAWNMAIKLRKEAGDLQAAAPFEEYVINSFAEKAKNIK